MQIQEESVWSWVETDQWGWSEMHGMQQGTGHLWAVIVDTQQGKNLTGLWRPEAVLGWDLQEQIDIMPRCSRGQ